MTKLKINSDLISHDEHLVKGLLDNVALITLMDNLRDMVIYFDQWGVAYFANRITRDWWGNYAWEGRSFVEIASNWDDPAERQRELMRVIRTGQSKVASRERVVQGDGQYWFEVDVNATFDASGRASGAVMILRDITEATRRELLMSESEARYRAYIANSSDAIWRYDVCPPIDISLSQTTQIELMLKRSLLAECNDKLAKLYGASGPSALIGLPIHHNGSPNIRADVTDFIANGYRLEDREYERQNNTGQTLSLQTSAIGIVEQGYLTRVWGTSRDITERRKYLSRMEYLINHDVLTGLPNRTVLYRTMNRAIKECLPATKMALLLIDLDRFKEINDTLGHLAGDKVLKQLGHRLENLTQSTHGLVARLGGDEFAIFLPDIQNSQHAIFIGHTILDSIAMVFELENLRTEISASIGVAMYPDQAEDVSTLMRFADVAMYSAKQRLLGISVYDPSLDPHSPKRLELIGALGRAIRENQLLLHYQPKIQMKSNRVYGFEALIRWDHPQLGLVAPDDFIPIAEHSSMIYYLMVWVMENGIRRCKEWYDQGVEVSVSMNVSARNLLDDRVVTDLKRLLDYHQLPPHLVELEITESTIMTDPARSEAALERIHQLGVVLSVDDFGTGYSSLAYLRRLPVQTLKIDSSFVRSMLTDEQDAIIVNSTINLAHNLGLQVVAEGVESADVYRKLAAMGCDDAQGFYMGRPLPSKEADIWLRESAWGLAGCT